MKQENQKMIAHQKTPACYSDSIAWDQAKLASHLKYESSIYVQAANFGSEKQWLTLGFMCILWHCMVCQKQTARGGIDYWQWCYIHNSTDPDILHI